LSASALLLVVSTASGLALPGWSVVLLVITAVVGSVGFVWWERRSRCPVIDLTLLRHKATASGLFAAMLGYLVLFGRWCWCPRWAVPPCTPGWC